MPPSPAQPTRSALVELLILAAPTVATMTSYTLMQFVDKLMVSRIGAEPIYVGAQGNGGLAAFVPIAVMMGFITVINTYVAQNLGAGKPEKAPAYAWAGMWLTLAYWVLVMLPFGLLLGPLLEWMRDPTLTGEPLAQAQRRDALAAGYGRILIFGSIFTMAARAIAQYFYGMHRPMVVLIASLTGNLVNFVLNTVLIFGPTSPAKTDIGMLDAWFAFAAGLCRRIGVPALGLDGSGYATVIGTAVELLIPVVLFLSARYHREFATRLAWRPSARHMRDLFKIGWPGSLMFGNEMLCWGFFMVYLVGTFGPMHSTAGWIAHQWMTLSFMPAVGLSVALTASVGKCMGMKRPDLAAQRAWLGVAMAAVYMTLCGVAFVLFRNDLTRLFIQRDTPPETAEMIVRLGAGFLVATAAFQFFDAIAMSLSGALRGAGDTKFTGVATLLLSWSILVVGGLAMVRFAPRLQSLGPWIAAAAYIVLLSVMILARFLTGKWRGMSMVESSSEVEAKPTVPLPSGASA